MLEIRDDITARVFLDEIGLLERLPKNSADQPIMAVVVEADHPTHAIVATYITGHPERVDNGHTVICFPKPRFTPTDVETYIAVSTENPPPPSADYLAHIRDGAYHHGLPEEYRTFLAGLT